MNKQGIIKLESLGAEILHWQSNEINAGISEGWVEYSFKDKNYSITWDDAIYWSACSDIDMSDIIHDSEIITCCGDFVTEPKEICPTCKEAV